MIPQLPKCVRPDSFPCLGDAVWQERNKLNINETRQVCVNHFEISTEWERT